MACDYYATALGKFWKRSAASQLFFKHTVLFVVSSTAWVHVELIEVFLIGGFSIWETQPYFSLALLVYQLSIEHCDRGCGLI